MNQDSSGLHSPWPHPPWFDPRMPAREDCVLRHMLDARAQRSSDRRAAMFQDGTVWTYAECREHVRTTAAALQKLGVGKGDRVLVWLPNGAPMLKAWFAINYLGAIFVPLNTACRGRILEHMVNGARARLMLAHSELVPRLAGLELTHLERVVSFGPVNAPELGVTVEDAAVLDAGDASALDDEVVIEPWSLQCIIYTSGTTGPSKGVLSPYFQLYTTALACYGYLREGEGMLVNLPMFHIGGTSAVYCALLRSATAYVVDGFDTNRFWTQVRQANCASTSGLIGVMGEFLASAEPNAGDRDNPLRCLTMFPVNERTVALAQRFGFDYVTGFNMTEVSVPLVAGINSRVYGSCGQPRSGVTCRIVDEHDMEVVPGAVGELIVRTDLPWTMNCGYDNDAVSTVKAWRNGWFHTGDAFRCDAAGNYFFVDRIKDTIRRRGENISSLEVESAVAEHPAVAEVVAVAVVAELSEDEVLIAVVPKAGEHLDPLALTEFLIPRLPYFMVPRYIRIVAGIPRTQTNKLRKVEVREAGIAAGTWDREAAGIHLRRERLETGR